jgi:hypothetical protein
VGVEDTAFYALMEDVFYTQASHYGSVVDTMLAIAQYPVSNNQFDVEDFSEHVYPKVRSIYRFIVLMELLYFSPIDEVKRFYHELAQRHGLDSRALSAIKRTVSFVCQQRHGLVDKLKHLPLSMDELSFYHVLLDAMKAQGCPSRYFKKLALWFSGEGESLVDKNIPHWLEEVYFQSLLVVKSLSEYEKKREGVVTAIVDFLSEALKKDRDFNSPLLTEVFEQDPELVRQSVLSTLLGVVCFKNKYNLYSDHQLTQSLVVEQVEKRQDKLFNLRRAEQIRTHLVNQFIEINEFFERFGCGELASINLKKRQQQLDRRRSWEIMNNVFSAVICSYPTFTTLMLSAHELYLFVDSLFYATEQFDAGVSVDTSVSPVTILATGRAVLYASFYYASSDDRYREKLATMIDLAGLIALLPEEAELRAARMNAQSDRMLTMMMDRIADNLIATFPAFLDDQEGSLLAQFVHAWTERYCGESVASICLVCRCLEQVFERINQAFALLDDEMVIYLEDVDKASIAFLEQRIASLKGEEQAKAKASLAPLLLEDKGEG